MAFEILNSAPVTPPRLHALVRLAGRLREPTRADLFDLLQPTFALPKLDNQNTVGDVFTAARSCGLLVEDERKVELLVEPQSVERLEDFRRHMQSVLLGVTDEGSDNYLLSLYSAWYVAQDDRVLRFVLKDFEVRFNSEIAPEAESRQFNTTKLNGWRNWAAFLGLGWPMTLGARRLLAPDARGRLEPLLGLLLPEGERPIVLGAFMDPLAERCPELDGGLLFERCWQASRGSERRGNRLSLALSNGLRVLHDTGVIELFLQPDAATRWQLFPAVGHPVQYISHIRRRRTT